MTRTTKLELTAVAIALLASMAIGSALMLVWGEAPGRIWLHMLQRTLGENYELGQVLYKATALTLTGLSVALALEAGLFNIGGEGQLNAGVLACASVGVALPAGTPAVLALALCVLAAIAAGALVGAAIGVMRAYRGAHEVITAIMLNAIVSGVSLWIGNEVLFEGGTTTGGQIVASARLPNLGFGGSSVNASLLIAIAAVAGMWWLRSRTTWGQGWRAVGRDRDGARSVGISIERTDVIVMTIAGALAGLAATNFVLGHKHAFEEGLGRGFGFFGVAAALLGRMNPIGVAGAALLLGFLSQGGLAVGNEIPKELTEMLQAVVVVAVVATAAWVRKRSEALA